MDHLLLAYGTILHKAGGLYASRNLYKTNVVDIE